MSVGEKMQFKAKITCLEGADCSREIPRWSVEGEIGTVSSTGLFTATKEGQGKVCISYCQDKVKACAEVIVCPAGLVWDSELQQCACPPGTYPVYSTTLSALSALSAQSQPESPTICCPPRAVEKNGKCVCPEGTSLTRDKAACCPTGWSWDKTTQKCVISPPVDKCYTSPFGLRCHPKLKKIKKHEGIDYKVSCGSKIKSPVDGKIIFAGSQTKNVCKKNKETGKKKCSQIVTGWGKYIKIKGVDNEIYIVAHLSKFLKESGKIKGNIDEIALSGTTGTSTGCHLHFEKWEPDKTKIDPCSILSSCECCPEKDCTTLDPEKYKINEKCK